MNIIYKNLQNIDLGNHNTNELIQNSENFMKNYNIKNLILNFDNKIPQK